MATGIDWTGRRAQATRARARGRRPTFKSAYPDPQIFATVQYFVQLPPGFSAEPALPAFCRLAFDFAGFNENLVAFCRLESFRWFYIFAGCRSFSLSKTDPKRRNALVSIVVVAERATGDPRVALKVRLSTRARRSRCACFGQRDDQRRSRKPRPCVSDHVQVTQNAPRHFRRFTQCCMRSRSRSLTSDSSTQDGVDRRIFRNARAAFGLSIAKKDFEDV